MVRHHVWGWFFKLPWVRRFDGFCLTPWDIVLRPGFENDRSLIAHEYNHCYWWRIHKLTFPLSYLLYGYARNPFEYLADHEIPHRSVLFRLFGAPENKGITVFRIREYPRYRPEDENCGLPPFKIPDPTVPDIRAPE